MTETTLVELGHGPTVVLMTRRRALVPPSPPPLVDAVSASSDFEASESQTKRRSTNSGSVADSKIASAGSNAAKLEARGGTTKTGGSNLTLLQDHPEDACWYSSKYCYNKRAVKNNGEMHKLCDKHHDSANQYQRKLEQRLKEKWLQSRMHALQTQAQAQIATQPHGHIPFGVDPAPVGTLNRMVVCPRLGTEMYSGDGSMPTESGGTVPQIMFQQHLAPVVPVSRGDIPTRLVSQADDAYEPFQHPVQLQSEDLNCLYSLFLA